MNPVADGSRTNFASAIVYETSGCINVGEITREQPLNPSSQPTSTRVSAVTLASEATSADAQSVSSRDPLDASTTNEFKAYVESDPERGSEERAPNQNSVESSKHNARSGSPSDHENLANEEAGSAGANQENTGRSKQPDHDAIGESSERPFLETSPKRDSAPDVAASALAEYCPGGPFDSPGTSNHLELLRDDIRDVLSEPRQADLTRIPLRSVQTVISQEAAGNVATKSTNNGKRPHNDNGSSTYFQKFDCDPRVVHKNNAVVLQEGGFWDFMHVRTSYDPAQKKAIVVLSPDHLSLTIVPDTQTRAWENVQLDWRCDVRWASKTCDIQITTRRYDWGEGETKCICVLMPHSKSTLQNWVKWLEELTNASVAEVDTLYHGCMNAELAQN